MAQNKIQNNQKTPLGCKEGNLAGMVPALSGGQVRQFLEMSLQEPVLPCPAMVPPIPHAAFGLLLVVGLLKGMRQE